MSPSGCNSHPDLAFENGQAVPVVLPCCEEGDEPSPVGQADRAEVASRLLALLTEGAASAEHIGRRALVLGHVMHLPGAARSQRELASRMKLSPARVNAILRVFRRQLAGFHGRE